MVLACFCANKSFVVNKARLTRLRQPLTTSTAATPTPWSSTMAICLQHPHRLIHLPLCIILTQFFQCRIESADALKIEAVADTVGSPRTTPPGQDHVFDHCRRLQPLHELVRITLPTLIITLIAAATAPTTASWPMAGARHCKRHAANTLTSTRTPRTTSWFFTPFRSTRSFIGKRHEASPKNSRRPATTAAARHNRHVNTTTRSAYCFNSTSTGSMQMHTTAQHRRPASSTASTPS